MKRLTLRTNGSDEAMKRLTKLKIEAKKRLMLHRLASSLHRIIAVNTIYTMQKSPKNKYVKAKTKMFFSVAMKNNKFLRKCQLDSSLHRFYALIFFFVKALRQRWQIREAMKQ
jgi:hypothetical protein